MVYATANHFRHVAAPMLAEQNARDYQSLFGCTPEVCALAWNLLDDAVAGASAKHLLWGLMLMKTYSKESMLCSKVGVTRATFRHWAWLFIRRIASLSVNVVSCVFLVYSLHRYCCCCQYLITACLFNCRFNCRIASVKTEEGLAR